LNQKSKNDPNEIQLDGINQFNTPILSTTWDELQCKRFFSKKIYRLTWGSILIWVGLLISKRQIIPKL
jgi:hypothetical protein